MATLEAATAPVPRPGLCHAARKFPLECDAPAHAHDREDQREARARGRGEMTVRLHDGQTAAQDIARWLANNRLIAPLDR